MAVKKYRPQPVLGAREQAKREAERLRAARTGQLAAAEEQRGVAARCQAELERARAYKKGADPRTDLAVARSDAMSAFLRQGANEKAPPANPLTPLQKML